MIRCCETIEYISYIARVAGSAIMDCYTQYQQDDYNKITVHIKADKSPITNADLISHQIIVFHLSKFTPNIPIISEECLPTWEECKKWKYFWLIDPLDGTKEFLSKNDEFTVNIAFIRQGEPILGVIYAPAYNILYAANNQQAWKVNSNGKRLKISVRKSNSPTIVMSRNCILINQQFLDQYLMKIKNYNILYIGSSLKFCLVAEGLAQFYPRFSATKIWDTAAGHVIVKSAGALINDWSGYSLSYKYLNELFINPGFQVSLC